MLRQTTASGPWRGGGARSPDRLGCASGDGSRGAACGGGCSAGTYASSQRSRSVEFRRVRRAGWSHNLCWSRGSRGPGGGGRVALQPPRGSGQVRPNDVMPAASTQTHPTPGGVRASYDRACPLSTAQPAAGACGSPLAAWREPTLYSSSVPHVRSTTPHPSPSLRPCVQRAAVRCVVRCAFALVVVRRGLRRWSGDTASLVRVPGPGTLPHDTSVALAGCRAVHTCGGCCG